MGFIASRVEKILLIQPIHDFDAADRINGGLSNVGM